MHNKTHIYMHADNFFGTPYKNSYMMLTTCMNCPFIFSRFFHAHTFFLFGNMLTPNNPLVCWIFFRISTGRYTYRPSHAIEEQGTWLVLWEVSRLGDNQSQMLNKDGASASGDNESQMFNIKILRNLYLAYCSSVM
jgi:hypothetical protein